MIINIWPMLPLDKVLLDIKPFLRKFRYRGFSSVYPIAAVRLDRPGIYPHPLASLQELSRSCARALTAEPGPRAVSGPAAIPLARARPHAAILPIPRISADDCHAAPGTRPTPCPCALPWVGGGPTNMQALCLWPSSWERLPR
jgi:hypothetical protein